MPAKLFLKYTELRLLSLASRMPWTVLILKVRKTAKNWNSKRPRPRRKRLLTPRPGATARSMPESKFVRHPGPQAIHSARNDRVPAMIADARVDRATANAVVEADAASGA